MKFRKLHLLFGILLFSSRIYSQSCSPSMLVGIWKATSSDSTSSMIFKDEKTINIIYKNKNVIFHYAINNINNECILSMQQTGRDSTSIIFSKLKMSNTDNFNLEYYLLKNYNTKTGVWEEMNLPPGSIAYFIRSK